jgi:hypothetical protein
MYRGRFLPPLKLVSAVVLGLATLAATPTYETESTVLANLLQRLLGLSKVELIPRKLPKQLPVNVPIP